MTGNKRYTTDDVWEMTIKQICDLLNEKEERIIELEKENSELHFLINEYESAKNDGYKW